MIKQLANSAEGSEESNKAYAQTVLNNLSVKDDEECPICFDVIQEPVLLPLCAHRGYEYCLSSTVFFHSRISKL